MCTHASMNIYTLTTCQTVSTKFFPPTWGGILFVSDITVSSRPYLDSKCPQSAQTSPPSIHLRSTTNVAHILLLSHSAGSQTVLSCMPPPTVHEVVTSCQLSLVPNKNALVTLIVLLSPSVPSIQIRLHSRHTT